MADFGPDAAPEAPQAVAVIVVVLDVTGGLTVQAQGQAEGNATIAGGMLARALTALSFPPHEHGPPPPKLEIARSIPNGV